MKSILKWVVVLGCLAAVIGCATYKFDIDGTALPAHMNFMLFKPDSTELLDSEKTKLPQVLEYIKSKPNKNFIVAGYTADVGSRQDQIDLSKKRAETVYRYLVDNGIPKDRLSFVGKGSAHFAPNKTEEDRQRNRSVVVLQLRK